MEQSTKRKIVIVGAILIVLLLVVLLLMAVYRYVIKGHVDQSTPSNKLPNFPLKWGSGSSLSLDPEKDKENVKALQRMCNSLGSSLVVDGIWGANTERAVNTLKILYPNQTAAITPVTDPVNENSHWEITEENLMAHPFNFTYVEGGSPTDIQGWQQFPG